MGSNGKFILRRDCDEEDIVNLVFAPWTLFSMGHRIRCPIMQPCQEFKLFQLQFANGNAQLLFQLPYRRILHTPHRPVHHVLWSVYLPRLHPVQWMRATRVRPNIRKGNLGRGALLQQQFGGGGVEEKDAERTVKNATGLGGLEDVRGFFGGRAGDDVGVGEDEDRIPFHELGLGHCGVPLLFGGGGECSFFHHDHGFMDGIDERR
mmetsp:Transcript_19672/g.42173  ORF Transcript_19672/g.42173 Transcript_19672/m.42173 type:complete len:206 (+) Transcript_19672:1803-2420(+)